jgi:hypothetical protein
MKFRNETVGLRMHAIDGDAKRFLITVYPR